MAATVAAISLLVLGGCVLLAAVHFDDRYRTDHVTGVRIALARYAAEGVLYPPLYDDGRYGGTRFMPLPILLHSALGRAVDDYLVGGRILSYATMLALLGLVGVLLTRWGSTWLLTVALLASIIGSAAALSALMGLRADSLPAALQVAAVALVAESARGRWAVASGVLAALALLAKTTAIWAPAAILLWLIRTDRRRLGLFLIGYATTLGVGLASVSALSGGRMLSNVLGLSTAGVDSVFAVVDAPYRLVLVLVDEAPSLWLLAPAAIYAVWMALRTRRGHLYQLSLVLAVLVLVLTLADRGTGSNQLLDAAALAALVVGGLAASRSPGFAHPAAAPVLALTLAWSNLAALSTVATDLRNLGTQGSLTTRPLSGLATASTTLLSEDPYVAASLGQMPTVLDPFVLQRIDRRDPAVVDDLIRRVRSQDFELVVLVEPLHPVDREWWHEFHFGPRVVHAINDAYRLRGRMDGYYVYVPVGG